MASDLLSALERSPVDAGGTRVTPCASVGVACFEEAGERSAEDMIAEADAAMYEAKGRSGDAFVVRTFGTAPETEDTPRRTSRSG